MIFYAIIIIIAILDFIFNLVKTKKEFTKNKNVEFKLPYGSRTIFLTIIIPSLMFNHLLISDCKDITLVLTLMCYIVATCILSIFLYEKNIKHIVMGVIITIVLNSLYTYFSAIPLYELVSKNDISHAIFIVINTILILITYFKIFDIFCKYFSYSYYANSKKYIRFVNTLTYIILIFSFTSLSAFQYKDNVINSISKCSSNIMSTFQPIPDSSNNNTGNNSNNSNNNLPYTPLTSTSQNAIYIPNDLPTLDDSIKSEIMKKYGNSDINGSVNWFIQDSSKFELLNYLYNMDCNHNPFYTARKLISNYLDVTVIPDEFNSLEYEDCSNNLLIDFTQYENETSEDYAKRIYSIIINKFCPSGIDLSNIDVGSSNGEKYIFSAYYNEVTSTYDILCLFFKHENEIVTNIHYDMVSISENPMPVYSNYFDILPVSQNNNKIERYQEYNIADKYYVMFKYYSVN